MIKKTITILGLFPFIIAATFGMERTIISEGSKDAIPTYGAFTYPFERIIYQHGFPEKTTGEVNLVVLPETDPTLSISIQGPFSIMAHTSASLKLNPETVRAMGLGIEDTDPLQPPLTSQSLLSRLMGKPLGVLLANKDQAILLFDFLKGLGKITWQWHLENNITNAGEFYISPQACSPFYCVLNDATRFVNPDGWEFIKSAALETCWTPLKSGGSATLLHKAFATDRSFPSELCVDAQFS
jgi:hypothetical protein